MSATHDPVNHPSHYTSGDIELIDALEASLSPEEFKGYLKGQVMKYLWRAAHKGSEQQDHEKAGWYLDRLISGKKKKNGDDDNALSGGPGMEA